MMLVLGSTMLGAWGGGKPYLAVYGGYSSVSNTDLNADVTFPGGL